MAGRIGEMHGGGKELFVRDVRTGKAGQKVVIGIPNNGASICVGDVFLIRYDVPRSTEGVSGKLPTPAPINEIKVALTVAKIEWPMRRPAEELPHGHAGALHLTGRGLENVTPNSFLMT